MLRIGHEQRRNAAEAPKHLSGEARAWWDSVLAEYELNSSQLKLLQAAGESWDAAQRARAEVASRGVLLEGRYGQAVQNPAATIEKEQRALFARIVAQLSLDEARRGPWVP